MTAASPPQIAVFTDLDGTLLDHHTYEFAPAIPVIRALRASGIPVFTVSSKTMAEQQALFDELDLFDGYVSENGGAVLFQGEVTVLGPGPGHIAAARALIEKHLGQAVAGFQLKNLSQVMARTGLDEASARLACKRICSDPLMIELNPQEIHSLNQRLRETGTKLVHGGRFLTLCGEADKGKAMHFLSQAYFGENSSITCLALGDSANDLPMLMAAECGILMPNPKGKGIATEQLAGLIQASEAGPVGWGQAVLQALRDLGVTISVSGFK